MTRNDIEKVITRKYRKIDRKLCSDLLDTYEEEIIKGLKKGERVILKNFITLEITQRPKRKARNPQTGDIVTYPPVKSIRCKVSRYFRDAVNKRKSEKRQ